MRSPPGAYSIIVTILAFAVGAVRVYAEDVKSSSASLLLLVVAMSAWGQDQNPPVPKFEDYPVKEVFKGTPAAPILTTPAERRFRIVIRRGVDNGWGVEGGTTNEPSGTVPNFAGHFVIIRWGCGSPCLMAAIVDVRLGVCFRRHFTTAPEIAISRYPGLSRRRRFPIDSTAACSLRIFARPTGWSELPVGWATKEKGVAHTISS